MVNSLLVRYFGLSMEKVHYLFGNPRSGSEISEM